MSGPSVYLTAPPLSLFTFPPENRPAALPPPTEEGTLRSPFPIDAHLYNEVLRWELPLAVATSYIVTVLLLNAYNRRYNFNEPWWISTTRPFKAFVVLHNIFLALFSLATFVAMSQAISRVWPGIDSTNGLAGVADSLCKIHGPRGIGDAVSYNTTLNIWETKNKLIHLLPEGTPDPTDVGRLWNEGLAFWGWFFYLSKFYEVIDTLIIIAKGRRSPTLQTYHHAGAMMCMWAGMRYMSPPIWMFVYINSGIHTLMYIYFTLTSMNVRVSTSIKRVLTTLQITQFVFGASYAALHLFVKYDIPIETVYKIAHPVASIVSVATSTASEMASSASSAVASGATWDSLFIRRMLLRAAGDEGVAENVRDPSTHQIAMPGVQEAIQRYQEETRTRTDWTTTNCIDTPGQAFAIYLNVIYLAPLTILFLCFFIKAYTSRTSSKTPQQTKGHALRKSAIDGAKGVDSQFDKVGRKAEARVDKGKDRIQAEVEKDIQQLKEGNFGKNIKRNVIDRVESFERKASPAVERFADRIDKAIRPEHEADVKKNGANDLDELKERVADSKQQKQEEVKQEPTEESKDEPKKEQPKAESKDVKKDDSSHLKVEGGDAGYESPHTEGEGEEGGEGEVGSEVSTPSKKKKNRHRNKKNKPSMTGSSMVDVSAEEQKGKQGDEKKQ